jgi:hypothetical protein
MTKAARIRTIQRVGRTLSDMEWADASLTLNEFGLPYAGGFDDYDSMYEYMLDRLRQGADETLMEIDRSLHDAGSGTAVDADGSGLWKAGMFRLFLSHTSANRRRAKSLANVFARYGIEAFVAHHTIQPTREWEREIVSALRSCDALCAILTEDFTKSLWCDQEVGFALARRKLVVPLRVDIDPYGFLGRVQAASFPTGAAAVEVADAVLNALVRSPLTSEQVSPAIVRRFVQSSDLTSPQLGFEMLRAIPRDAWTTDMITQVDRATLDIPRLAQATLADGMPLPDAATDLLAAVRPPVAPSSSTADDDIPF